MEKNRYVIGITGASGTIYGLKTVESFLAMGAEVHLIVTPMGTEVMYYETGFQLTEWVEAKKKEYKNQLILEDYQNLFAGPASGSYDCDGVILVPCSMSTLGELGNGITKNLMTRAADVALKQKRPLVIVPRETPLSTIHLENMLTLSKAGAYILPAMPGFYQKPEAIEDMVDFMVGKILDCLNIKNKLYDHWQGK